MNPTWRTLEMTFLTQGEGRVPSFSGQVADVEKKSEWIRVKGQCGYSLFLSWIRTLVGVGETLQIEVRQKSNKFQEGRLWLVGCWSPVEAVPMFAPNLMCNQQKYQISWSPLPVCGVPKMKKEKQKTLKKREGVDDPGLANKGKVC